MSPQEEMKILGSLFDKLIRQIRLYGSDHAQTEAALRDLSMTLGEKLKETSGISLSLQRTALLFEDEPIIEITKSEGNYIQESFVDGVRSFTFSSGIEEDEVLRFCQVLGRDYKTYEFQEEDTVTLLWKQDFSHIDYETVDIYASDRMALLQNLYSSSMDDSEKTKEEDRYLETFVSKLIHPRPAAIGEAGPIGIGSKHHLDFQEDINQAVPKEFFYWDSDIEESFSEKVSDLLKKDLRPEVATIFSEILESTEGDEFDLLCQNYCNRIRDYFLKGDLLTANSWLRRLRAIQSFLGSTNVEIYESVDQGLLEAFEVQLFDDLTSSFVEESRTKPEDWILFFQYLGPKNLHFTGKLLELFLQETFHSKAVELFKSFHYRYSFHFKEFLNSTNSLLVRDGVRLLGPTLEDSSFQTELSKLAIHPDPNVRMEVLKVLRGKEEDVRLYFFRRAISDTEMAVRLLAFNELASQAVQGLAKPIALKVSSEEFLQAPLEEKRAALLALSKSEASDAESFILQIIETNEINQEHRELQIAAIYSLTSFPSIENEKLLGDLSDRRLLPKSLRDAAKSASHKIGSQLQKEEKSESV